MVTLTTEVLTTMRAHAERAWPEECVGALLSDGATVLGLRNAAVDRRTSFLITARDYLAVEAAAEAQGLSVLGFYHSHPDGPSEPSLADAASATPGLWTFVLSVTGGVAAAPRAFHFEHERFVECPVLSEAGTAPPFTPTELAEVRMAPPFSPRGVEGLLAGGPYSERARAPRLRSGRTGATSNDPLGENGGAS